MYVDLWTHAFSVVFLYGDIYYLSFWQNLWTRLPFVSLSLMKQKSNNLRMPSRIITGLNSSWVCYIVILPFIFCMMMYKFLSLRDKKWLYNWYVNHDIVICSAFYNPVQLILCSKNHLVLVWSLKFAFMLGNFYVHKCKQKLELRILSGLLICLFSIWQTLEDIMQTSGQLWIGSQFSFSIVIGGLH